MDTIDSPYPWFGGKSKVVDLVWSRFGKCPNYVEPFFGGGAVLLKRPSSTFCDNRINRETVNDYDGHIANFWRSCKYAPDEVAEATDRPVNEIDLHAIGDALFCRPSKTWSMAPTEWVQWIREDEQHYDPVRAGQWCWFVSNWIGSLPSVGDAGQGVWRTRPELGGSGKGISRQRPHLSDSGNGECARTRQVLVDWMRQIQDRLRNVRVCCGDWSRVCGRCVTWKNATPCAVFLDPPYSAEAGRNNNLYSEECGKVAHDVRAWCIEEGANHDMRIALCGYEGEHESLESLGWSVVAWKSRGGYANTGAKTARGNRNRDRERIWFSPGCVQS